MAHASLPRPLTSSEDVAIGIQVVLPRLGVDIEMGPTLLRQQIERGFHRFDSLLVSLTCMCGHQALASQQDECSHIPNKHPLTFLCCGVSDALNPLLASNLETAVVSIVHANRPASSVRVETSRLTSWWDCRVLRSLSRWDVHFLGEVEVGFSSIRFTACVENIYGHRAAAS